MNMDDQDRASILCYSNQALLSALRDHFESLVDDGMHTLSLKMVHGLLWQLSENMSEVKGLIDANSAGAKA